MPEGRGTQPVSLVVGGGSQTGTPQPDVLRSAWLVNSTLDQFIASVRAVTARFPFDSEGTGEDSERNEPSDTWAHEDKIADEWDQAAGDLTEILRHIDPAAVADPDGFWMTFVADVQMGDYSIRDIVNEPEV